MRHVTCLGHASERSVLIGPHHLNLGTLIHPLDWSCITLPSLATMSFICGDVVEKPYLSKRGSAMVDGLRSAQDL